VTSATHFFIFWLMVTGFNNDNDSWKDMMVGKEVVGRNLAAFELYMPDLDTF